MMRWWETDVFVKKRTQSEDEVLKMREDLIHEEDKRIANESKGLKQFTFRVEAKTSKLERIGVTGNCAELGAWVPEGVVLLDREGETDIWSKDVNLPLLLDDYIKYRYVVVTDINYTDENIKKGGIPPLVKSLRRWEANPTVRKIAPVSTIIQPTASFRKEYLNMSVEAIREAKRERIGPPQADTFGYVNDTFKISMGWLTSEDALELKLFRNSLRLFDKSFSKKPIFVQLRTIKVEGGIHGQVDFCEDLNDGWPVVEVSGLSEAQRTFKRQETYGERWCRNDNLIFLVFHDNCQNLGIVLDFHVYTLPDVSKPYHTGSACLHPYTISEPEGIITTDVFNIKSQTIGEIKLKYAMIRRMKPVNLRLNHSLSSLWTSMWSPAPGANVIKTCSETRDNIVASVIDTTTEGYDYVEISIQYTKDNLPVFSHSPYITVALRHPGDINVSEQYQVPVNKFTLSLLHRLRIIPVDQCDHILKLKRKDYPKDDNNRPFPSVMQLLNNVDKKVGFIIELNTMLPLENGSYKEYHEFDVNDILDKLLKALQQSAGRRDIILASFHPDVCAMMKLKQNTYPVIFLFEGMLDKYPKYDRDERCADLDSAIHFAVSLELNGLGLSEDTIMFPGNAEKITKEKLVIYCLYYDESREMILKEYMAKYKLSGILCKRSDKYGRFRRTLSYSITPKPSERKQFIQWSNDAKEDGCVKPEVYPLEHPYNTVSFLESIIDLPPNQTPTGLSKYKTIPILVEKDTKVDATMTKNEPPKEQLMLF